MPNNRTLTYKIFRHDPKDPNSVPHYDTFQVVERPFLSVYLVDGRNPAGAGSEPVL